MINIMLLMNTLLIMKCVIRRYECKVSVISIRTDCCFSPDDKLLVTGTSVRKDEGNGKLLFFERQSLQKVYEIEVADTVGYTVIFTNNVTKYDLTTCSVVWDSWRTLDWRDPTDSHEARHTNTSLTLTSYNIYFI